MNEQIPFNPIFNQIPNYDPITNINIRLNQVEKRIKNIEDRITNMEKYRNNNYLDKQISYDEFKDGYII